MQKWSLYLTLKRGKMLASADNWNYTASYMFAPSQVIFRHFSFHNFIQLKRVNINLY